MAMWLRSELKAQAKYNLKNKYWSAFAVSLLVALLGGGGAGIFSQGAGTGKVRLDLSQGRVDFPRLDRWQGELSDLTRLWPRIWPAILAVGLVALLFGLAYSIFLAPVIQVGGRRWFSRARESAFAPSAGMTFSHFQRGRYWSTVAGIFRQNLFLFFWSLLALLPFAGSIIFALTTYMGRRTRTGPGFPFGRPDHGDILLLFGLVGLSFVAFLLTIPRLVKSYSYRMTGWILADNPAVGARRALQLSIQLTRGHKWDIFVLDLSFIGWFLLGLLACGIGVIFVTPYYEAVQAELYDRLRQLGVEQGFTSMEELGFIRVEEPLT